jgi:glutaminase
MGDEAQVFVLQGEMHFATAESAVRAIYKAARVKKFIIVNFIHVSSIDAGANKLLESMIRQITKCTDCLLVFAVQSTSLFSFSTDLHQPSQAVHYVDSMDYGIEWCENLIIAQSTDYRPIPNVSLDQNELCLEMSPAQIKIIEQNTQQKFYNPGDYIIHAGQKSENIFFLIQGDVSVRLHHDNDSNTRIATFSGGMFFGEMVLLGQLTRTADVVADSKVECRVLTVNTINALNDVDQNLKVHLLENIAKRLAKNLVQSNIEIATLSDW